MEQTKATSGKLEGGCEYLFQSVGKPFLAPQDVHVPGTQWSSGLE